MNTIPLFYSFARSGGTLVNRLLGVHPDCLVLSEVNPAASYKPVVEQAVEWLGLVAAGDSAEFSRRSYREQLAMLHGRAAQRGKSLVVRDWVTVNFLPGAAGLGIVPSGELEQALYLERAGLEPRAVVVTRASSDVYASIRRSFPHLRELGTEEFAKAYLAYAKRVAGLPRLALEALRDRPAETVTHLLVLLGVTACDPQTLLGRFAHFANCTGDTTLEAGSRSAAARGILPPDADSGSGGERHAALAEADSLLGYER